MGHFNALGRFALHVEQVGLQRIPFRAQQAILAGIAGAGDGGFGRFEVGGDALIIPAQQVQPGKGQVGFGTVAAPFGGNVATGRRPDAAKVKSTPPSRTAEMAVGGWSKQPIIEMLIPSTLDDTLATADAVRKSGIPFQMTWEWDAEVPLK